MFVPVDLAMQKCVPYESGMASLPMERVRELLDQLTLDWVVVEEKRLQYQFEFDSFMEAMVFVNDLAALAEEEGHHPDIAIYFRQVDVALTTHAIDGLSDNDFILARKIEVCCR